MKTRIFFLIIVSLVNAGVLQAQLRMPSLFSDHMVVQKSSELLVWGWSDVNDQLTVKASWDNVEVKAVCSHVDGRWAVKIKTPQAGGPYTIDVKDAHKSLLFSDVMVGEVWLCSGQSNMEFQLAGANHGMEEINATSHPDVRFFRVPKTASDYPQDNCYGAWQTSNSADMYSFSAVGYFFAKELSARLHETIGMINASWGGSPIEIWMRENLIRSDSLLYSDAMKNDTRWSPVKPGSVFNAMINPLTFYPITGVIWYQGESNVDHYPTYSLLMQKLISCWRTEWKADLPFYFVQIAPYTYGSGKSAYLREQQTLASKLPNTGMVVISDLVSDTSNIHPKDKQEVGNRLANLALSKHYSLPGIIAESPNFLDMQIKGKEALLNFSNCDNGLEYKPGKTSGFEIAGSDGRYYAATVQIKGKSVLLSSSEVANPVSVKYCFTDAAIPTLFSKEGLPVNSFRASIPKP